MICHNGQWGMVGGQTIWTQGAECPSDSNASYGDSSDSLNYISTGYAN